MKKKKDIKEPSVCNCNNLRRAAQAITKIYDRKLAPSGLTINQYLLLDNILVLSPVSVSDLALYARLDRTTLVRNLKLLEQRGLIIDVSPEGARRRQLQLSAIGKEKRSRAEKLWREAQLFMNEHIGIDKLQQLTELLFEIESLNF